MMCQARLYGLDGSKEWDERGDARVINKCKDTDNIPTVYRRIDKGLEQTLSIHRINSIFSILERFTKDFHRGCGL